MQESINFWDARNSEGGMPIYSVPTEVLVVYFKQVFFIDCAYWKSNQNLTKLSVPIDWLKPPIN